VKVIKFAPGLVPVLKHQEHDQSSHGSWADGSSLDAMPFEWKPVREEPTWGTSEAFNAKEAFEEVANSPIATRLWGGELDMIVKDGRFKTLDEIPHGEGLVVASDEYRAGRAELEGDAWRVPKDAIRPIYGYLDTDDPQHQRGAELYGDVKVIFKDNIAGRTTVTAGDSLNYKLTPVLVSELQSKKASADDAMRASRSHGLIDYEGNKRIKVEYFETQIHGGIKLKDIKSVTLDRFSQVEPDTITVLKQLGIEVTVKNG
jgi:hypothetical protein